MTWGGVNVGLRQQVEQNQPASRVKSSKTTYILTCPWTIDAYLGTMCDGSMARKSDIRRLKGVREHTLGIQYICTSTPVSVRMYVIPNHHSSSDTLFFAPVGALSLETFALARFVLPQRLLHSTYHRSAGVNSTHGLCSLRRTLTLLALLWVLVDLQRVASRGVGETVLLAAHLALGATSSWLG